MESTKRARIYFAVVCFGFASMVAQILLLRELIVVFYGNELSSGIMLASWLFWVATGSFAVRTKKSSKRLFQTLLLSISAILPLAILLIRNIKNSLGVLPGEMIGFVPMAASSFILVAPVSFVFGALFTLSCGLHIQEETDKASLAAGKIYLVESLGAVAGGLVFNFILVYLLKPFQIALLCGILTTIAALAIIDKKKSPFTFKFVSVLTVTLAIFVFLGANQMDLRAREIQWKNFDLIAVKDSKYGNITISKLGSQLNLFENGLLVAATNDPHTAEESVQYAMLEHSNPKRVLLIGGSLSGSLDEILKHPIERVDCVELDPDMIKVAKNNYPKPLIAAFADPRVNIHYPDGRRFIKNLAQKDTAKYDVVILTLPNPYTAQINRFYSREFYSEVKKVLEYDGVFSFGVTSSENYIGADEALFLACLYKGLEEEFKDVKILPGDTAFFFASPQTGVLTYDYNLLLKRIGERGLNLKYVNEHYLPDRFNAQRIDYLKEAVEVALPAAKINYDFRPVGYFYDTILWSARLDSGVKGLFKKLYNLTFVHFAIFLFIIFALLFISKRKTDKSKDVAIALSIATIGFSTMLFQVAIIIAFQAIYGYVYYKIGLIFSAFMLGLAAGSFAALKIRGDKAYLTGIYRKIQASLCVYSLLIPFLFARSAAFEEAFLALPLVAGIIGGLQFPLANKIYYGDNPAKTAGLLYGMDLFGACVGALLTSAILIPVLGISETCYLTALLNLLVFVYLQRSNLSSPRLVLRSISTLRL